jgi:hypothetical protein
MVDKSRKNQTNISIKKKEKRMKPNNSCQKEKSIKKNAIKRKIHKAKNSYKRSKN